MPRGCSATNRWRRKRLRDRWVEERQQQKQSEKKPKNRRKSQRRGVVRITHSTGHVIDYFGTPESAKLRIVVSGDLTIPLPPWPGSRGVARMA